MYKIRNKVLRFGRKIPRKISMFALRMKRKKLITFIIYCALLLFYCEFLIYYIVESQCQWPPINITEDDYGIKPIKAIILSDIHMLGPRHGHWLDKLRREWQMHRSFQTSITLFNPEIIFILGDIFDEGQNVDNDEFQEYVRRFHKLFYVPKSTKLIVVVGNHDVGFHYRMHPYFTDRFEENFNNTGVSLFTFRDVHFITINSMAMKNDNCYFCETSIKEIDEISGILKCAREPSKCKKNRKMDILYSQPIILQHFPTYRPSDKICMEHDSPVVEEYRENWEVLSRDSTHLLGKQLQPRLTFSGHSHHYCRLKNSLGIEEFTLASYNWRNKNNPSFILAQFTPWKYSVSLCMLPQESTVIGIYLVGIMFPIILCVYLKCTCKGKILE